MFSPQPVPHLMVEDEDDWVVSFALGAPNAGRLTLTRAPRLEFMVQPERRGVSIGCDRDQRSALLVAVTWGAKNVDVVSTDRRYRLDISRVDQRILADALRVLGKMNFDQRFQLAGA